MSGTVPDPAGSDPAREESELLAAEYVLGTLDAPMRATVAREMELDPVLRQSVEAWERWLSPLLAVAAPVSPPATLWSRIEADAWGSGAAAPVAARPRMSRSVRVWQGMTAAGFALAAAIAGFAVLRPVPPAPPPGQVTALLPLSQSAGAAVFVAQAAPDGALRVTPVGGLHVAADRDLELWLLKDGESVPHPLGLLREGRLQLAAGSLQQGIKAKLLVSLEPRGGSPTGLPTGPVLWGGGI